MGRGVRPAAYGPDANDRTQSGARVRRRRRGLGLSLSLFGAEKCECHRGTVAYGCEGPSITASRLRVRGRLKSPKPPVSISFMFISTEPREIHLSIEGIFVIRQPRNSRLLEDKSYDLHEYLARELSQSIDDTRDTAS